MNNSIKKQTPQHSKTAQALLHREGYKKQPSSMLYVVKGRSYTEPIFRGQPPIAVEQRINELVGNNEFCRGDYAIWKKHMEAILACEKNIVLSEHFILGSKETGWERGQIQRKRKHEISELDGRKKSCAPITIPLPVSKRLYPYENLKAQKNIGQCYSLMMEAKGQQRMYYAEVSRASRTASKVSFIKKKQLALLTTKSLAFEGHKSSEQVVAKIRKALLNNKKLQGQSVKIGPLESKVKGIMK